ncbi:MAG: hypothetical protein AAF481_16450 [Acidobacteriota bacterium]
MKGAFKGLKILILCAFTLLSAWGVGAQEFECRNGELPAAEADGVVRIFKPVVVDESFDQTMRPRRYHQPWKRLQYAVPAGTTLIEGFGPPSGGAADQSRVFRGDDTLPLGVAEKTACERFREASFTVYSKDRADREFVRDAEMKVALAKLEGRLDRVTSELTQAKRESSRLVRRVGELEAELEAVRAIQAGSP